MSTHTTVSPQPAHAASPRAAGLVPYRFTVRQFEQMIGAGVFREGDCAELLNGVVSTVTKHPPHNFCVGALSDLLRPILGLGFFLAEEKSARSGRYWRPEPDIAVVRGARSDFRRNLPTLRQIALAVEVADTSYRTDRTIKWRKYAASGVPAYWIVSLENRIVEVFTRPSGRGKSAAYHDTQTYNSDAQIPVALDRQEIGAVKVSEFLP